MKFKHLKVFELFEDDIMRPTWGFDNVDITYSVDGQKTGETTAVATVDGKVVATLDWFSDDQVEIFEDRIIIEGLVLLPAPKTENKFGEWELKNG